MAGPSLTAGSTLQCPHGAAVQITPSNAHAKAGGDLLATAADTFVISGCPFAPGGTPMPCLTVQWTVTDQQVTAGAATLDQSSVGLCLNAAQAPQGPVVVVSTQSAVQSR